MEPTSISSSDTSKKSWKLSSVLWRKGTDMDFTLALMLSLLQLSVCMAAPGAVDVVNIGKMKTKVKWMAEQLVVRLDTDFQVPIGMTLDPPADELGGPASIVAVLEGYHSLISDSLGGVLQIKAEISSLAGYLNHWRQGHCKEQRPKPVVPGPLQELQRRKGFIHTVTFEALMRVKEFLTLLLKNLDHLEKC